MAKRRKAPSMQGSAADTTNQGGSRFMATRFPVVTLPKTYRSPRTRFGTYKHRNKLTGADQNPSPGVQRYIVIFPKSRRRF